MTDPVLAAEPVEDPQPAGGPGLGPELAPEPSPESGPEPIPLLEPREGVPPVVAGPTMLASVVSAFAAGTGPVGIDAERASGYRYGQRAYLVQLRRAGAGSALIDPVGCPDLSTLDTALADAEWVLHAANQDLPCLAELGMRPRRLFDTELAGRLAGYPRVGLGPLVQEILGFSLEKGHAAADWSTRPLPEPWLRYAALDVEVLVELRDALVDVLAEQGKLGWALEEFAAIAAAPAPGPRVDPWRRTSGMHRARGRRQLAVVRSLWLARDVYARRRDVAPGRVLPDGALVEAAMAEPRTMDDLAKVAPFNGHRTRRHLPFWWDAVQSAYALPQDELPTVNLPSDSPPPARSWPDRDAAAAARLSAARSAMAAIADEHRLPVENLVAPDCVRRICWEPPQDLSADGIAAVLTQLGARRWQVELTASVLAGALSRLRNKADE